MPIDDLRHLRCELWSLPSWSSEDEVRRALHALSLATPASAADAYSRVLFAVGNNHAGTYFPAVLAIVAPLGAILRDARADGAARARTLDVLIDLLGAFAPEPGFEEIVTPRGPRRLDALLEERVATLRSDVARLLADSPPGSEEAALAGELLALLDA